MKQIWITRKGGPEVLQLRETADPVPGSDQVLIKVRAAGVNFSDILARRGRYPEAPNPPVVVGYEVSGIIEAVGEGVHGFRVGQSVIAPVFFGGYSTKVCVPKEQVFSLPAGMTFSDGAALAVNYLTAFGTAMKMARLKKEDRVLIYSAGGGVGLALFDLCRRVGAIPIGIASVSKHTRLQERGFQTILDSQSPTLDQDIFQLSQKGGFDVIFDTRGGNSWSQALNLLAPFGKLIAFGFSSALDEITTGQVSRPTEGSAIWYSADLFQLAQSNTSVSGFNLATLWRRSFSELGPWMEELLKFYQAGDLNITVDKEFPFTEAAQAHRYLEDRKNFGKVLLVN